MERIKEEFNRYKWILLAGIIVSILIGLIAANFHVIRFIGYKVNNDTKGIITILESHVKNKNSQSEWYFTSGITELLNDEEWPEETLLFINTNFNYFNDKTQLEVIDGYNKKKLFLNASPELVNKLMTMIDNKTIQDYIKRMSPEQLEQGLVMYYGKNPEVSEKFIDEIYNLLKLYPNKIPYNEFKFDLKQILTLEGEENNTKKVTIFEGINADNARTEIMKSFKNQSLSGEELKYCVEFLNKTDIIDNETYINFNNMYSEIFVLRDKYKELEVTQVELENQKQAIEVQIGQSLVQLEAKQKEVAAIESEIKNIDSELGKVTDYAYMALYIEKKSGTGSNEYEASIPRKGIFGDYKPSSQKYIVSLSETSFLVEGVYYLDIYMSGTKVNDKGNEYPYYVEVSKAQKDNISRLQENRQNKTSEKNTASSEVKKLEADVNRIKDEMGYEENDKQLKSIPVQREELTKQVDEKIIDIKKMFGLSGLTIDIKP